MSLGSKQRLDQAMVQRGLVLSRSQAESYIKLGRVSVNDKLVTKPGSLVSADESIELKSETYVSRAGLKLSGAAEALKLNFKNKVVLDVGSSTGGFTDFALRHGAKAVIAVDVGSDQMHISLRNDRRVELHEKTDIRQVRQLSASPDIVVIDVSFISLKQVLPAVKKLASPATLVVAMVKPQFEAEAKDINKGVVKNDSLRRQILKDFEAWVKGEFVIVGKADSQVRGAKGNTERFYVLKSSI